MSQYEYAPIQQYKQLAALWKEKKEKRMQAKHYTCATFIVSTHSPTWKSYLSFFQQPKNTITHAIKLRTLKKKVYITKQNIKWRSHCTNKQVFCWSQNCNINTLQILQVIQLPLVDAFNITPSQTFSFFFSNLSSKWKSVSLWKLSLQKTPFMEVAAATQNPMLEKWSFQHGHKHMPATF